MKRKFLDTILAFALVLLVVSALAHTWQQFDTPQSSIGAVGLSADGRIICAAPSASHAMISTNWGSAWMVSTSSPPLGPSSADGVAVSADGSKIFGSFSSNGIYVAEVFLSMDQGKTWTQTGFPKLTNRVIDLACSADGTRVIAGLGNSGIFISTNGGLSCYTSSAPVMPWTSVASSADGTRLVAATYPGSVYFSEDAGDNWSPANLPSSGWSSVCISSDGKWVGASFVVGPTYISSNSGVSWKTNQIQGAKIACSADGSDWLITGSQVYTSTNGGSTWATNLSSSHWNSGAVSADGCEMVAAANPGTGIQIGRLTPSPQMSIQWQESGLALSWLIPSTNFVLQQSDLSTGSWTSVSNNPTLNFTNLNQEVTVPASGSNAFFRLNAQ